MMSSWFHIYFFWNDCNFFLQIDNIDTWYLLVISCIAFVNH